MEAFSNFNRSLRRLSMVPKGVLLGAAIVSLSLPLINVYFIKNTLTENTKLYQEFSDFSRHAALALLEKKDIPGACGVLQASLDKDLVRFYIVQLNTLELCSGPKELRSEINAKYANIGIPVESGSFTFETEKVENYLVTTGAPNDSFTSLMAMFRPKIPRMLLGWFFGTLMISILVQILSRPWKNMVTTISGAKSKKGFVDILGESREFAQVDAASKALKTEALQLRTAMKFIALDFATPLINRMLQEKRQFPYFFKGSFLRFDLNGYTKIYFENDKLRISEIINSIAVDVDELVNRYEGYHYAFGGDEFVELFLGDDSSLRALACARDIFAIAAGINQPEKIRESVKFKASVAKDSEILFSRLPQCYSLTSDALILTNRLFTLVEEKQRHSLLTGETDSQELSALAKFKKPENHLLRNFSKEVGVSHLDSFLTLQDILERTDRLDLIKYFRSDIDITTLFGLISDPKTSADLKKQSLSFLKSLKIETCQTFLPSAWIRSIELLDDQWKENIIILSSLINSGKNLIPQKAWSSTLSQKIISIQGLKDPRVKADIIELLSLKVGKSDFEHLLKTLMAAEDLSIRANGNILIAEAEYELTPQVVKRLSAMFKSGNPNEVATAIYCTSRIILSYRDKNPLILSQHLEFEDLVSLIDKNTTSENPMVRGRATIEKFNLNKEA